MLLTFTAFFVDVGCITLFFVVFKNVLLALISFIHELIDVFRTLPNIQDGAFSTNS